MLGIIAMVVAGVSLILDIVGLAIPYWENTSIVGTDVHTGLWSYCIDSECVSIPDILESSELKAVRAFVILGMIVLAGALVCALLKLAVMKDQELLPKVAGACAELAGAFMLVGVVIYAAKVKSDGTDLHAGFALTIVAAVGSLISGGLFFADKGQ